MATNLRLDDKSIQEAQKAGKHKTKKEAVTAALEDYVRRRRQMRILDAFGRLNLIQPMTARRSGLSGAHDGTG